MRLTGRRPSLRAVGARSRPSPALALLAIAAQVAVGTAIAVGATLAMTALLLVVTVASPVAAFVVAWLAWRSDRDRESALARLQARCGGVARVISGDGAGE